MVYRFQGLKKQDVVTYIYIYLRKKDNEKSLFSNWNSELMNYCRVTHFRNTSEKQTNLAINSVYNPFVREVNYVFDKNFKTTVICFVFLKRIRIN